MDKSRHERLAQKYLAHVCLAGTMESLFDEFEDCNSVAARTTHEADSLDCRIQAVIYISRYPQIGRLFEFLDSPPLAVYFKTLTNLLLIKESSLRGERPQPEIVFVIGKLLS